MLMGRVKFQLIARTDEYQIFHPEMDTKKRIFEISDCNIKIFVMPKVTLRLLSSKIENLEI